MNILLAASGGDHIHLLFTLFVMFAAAKLAAEIFERLHQPTVAGEILAGVLIGPAVLGLVAPDALTSALAEIGVIFLLFNVGLETKPASIFQVGGRALVVAVLGVVLPFVAGFALMWALGRPSIEAFFLGAAMVATSVGITARVLGEMGMIETQTSRIILGAAVIDDILGLLILAVVSSLAKGEASPTQMLIEIGTTAALAIGFTLLVAFVGARAVRRIHPRVENLRLSRSWFLFGMILCLGLALVASWIGVAAIIGAFLAGMALSEAAEDTDMPHQAETISEFFLPFFLTNIGMQVKAEIFLNREIILLALVVTVLAVLTKLIGCGLGALSMGRRKAMQIGMGMVPRGEVGIVVAQIGLGLAAVSSEIYGVVLVMAVATTLIAPPFLRRLYKDEPVEKTRVPASQPA